MIGFIGFILTGMLAGWLAGQLTKGKGFGLTTNLILGVLGSLLGGVIFWILGFSSHGFIASTIVSTIGAILVLYLVNKLKHNV